MSIVGARDAYERGEITYEEAKNFELDWKYECQGDEDPGYEEEEDDA